MLQSPGFRIGADDRKEWLIQLNQNYLHSGLSEFRIDYKFRTHYEFIVNLLQYLCIWLIRNSIASMVNAVGRSIWNCFYARA